MNAHRVQWFRPPDRPVEGNTIYVRQDTGEATIVDQWQGLVAQQARERDELISAARALLDALFERGIIMPTDEVVARLRETSRWQKP